VTGVGPAKKVNLYGVGPAYSDHPAGTLKTALALIRDRGFTDASTDSSRAIMKIVEMSIQAIFFEAIIKHKWGRFGAG
jgi:hypothetical protein